MTRKRLAILISGRGSNMEALLRAALDPAWPMEPAIVISNRPEAAGLAKARSFGIGALAVDHAAHGKDRESFERALDVELKQARVDLIALAGFMRVLTPWFVNEWSGRLVNIHPSLLPKYPGLDTHKRCLEAGDLVHGCTVHLVTAGVDQGPAVGCAQIDVRPGDSEATLATRLLKAEHLLYPRCIAALARKDLERVREDVVVDGETIRLWAPQ